MADQFRRRAGSVSRTPIEENTMTAIYTFDVFCSLDGFGSYGEGGDWGGYWGRQGPEFLDRRLAQYEEEQRLVLGANTFREFLHVLGPSAESPVDDAINTRWPASRRSPRWRCGRTAAWR
jgi:hypothetical protein